MNNKQLPFTYLFFRSWYLQRIAVLLCGVLFAATPLLAEGTQDVAPSPEDVVMLLIGDDNFANFASPGAPESSRLYVQLNGAEETLYLGLSREFTDSGSPASTGSYSFRIRRASDDQIVHGPFSVKRQLAPLS